MKEMRRIIVQKHMISVFILIILNNIFLLIKELKNYNLLNSIMLAVIANLISYSIIYVLVSIFHKIIWKIYNKSLNVDGDWYHVHIINANESYLRIGKANIEQDYFYLTITAQNYNVRYNDAQNELLTMMRELTIWRNDGDGYYLSANRTISGSYTAIRTFKNNSIKNGLHIFVLYQNKKMKPDKFVGNFYDAIPNYSSGVIYMFRSEIERDNFAMKLSKSRLKSDSIFESKID